MDTPEKDPRRHVNVSLALHRRLMWASFQTDRSAKSIAEEALTLWLDKYEAQRGQNAPTTAAGDKNHV